MMVILTAALLTGARKLSALCDLEHHRIIEIEQGKINITFTTLFELASGLEIDPAELLRFLKD